ncbi:MAG: nucleotidyltransferase domain-containing protein [bacterium]|nr:nucleotidyltransferase domain-containing protein [bacterium]
MKRERAHSDRAAPQTEGDRGRVLEVLLGSRGRARLLAIFTTHPGEEYYAQQLMRLTGLSEGSVRHALRRLEDVGVLVARRHGRERLYRLNEHHPVAPELKQMVYKTAGLGDVLRVAVSQQPGITSAFIYGSVAGGGERPSSDLDLLVIGEPDREKLAAALEEAERTLRREINLVTMTVEEWLARAAAGEGFVNRLLQSPKIFLVGDEQSLR